VAGLPLAAQLDPRAVLDAGRDADLEAPRPPLAAGAVAVGAGILDDRAVPAAARARLREREQALALGDHAAAAALGTHLRRGAALRSRAAALVTGRLERARNR